MSLESRIGRKGEIYPPKPLRDAVNMKPGDKVILEVRGEELVVRKVPRVKDLLKLKAKTAISVEEDLKLRRDLSKRLTF